jgi:acetate kinase
MKNTSVVLTPAGGLMIGSRPVDVGPGVAWNMIRLENMTSKQFNIRCFNY